MLDFGANLSGLPKITGSAPAGTKVTMVPAEQVNPDGTINIGSTGASPTSQILYDYTFAGRGRETWHAQFTYNGFQYLEVRGLPAKPTPDTITLLVTHASNRQTATFDELQPDAEHDLRRSPSARWRTTCNRCSPTARIGRRARTPATTCRTSQTDLTLFDMQAYEGQLVANMRTSQRPTPLSSEAGRADREHRARVPRGAAARSSGH